MIPDSGIVIPDASFTIPHAGIAIPDAINAIYEAYLVIYDLGTGFLASSDLFEGLKSYLVKPSFDDLSLSGLVEGLSVYFSNGASGARLACFKRCCSWRYSKRTSSVNSGAPMR